MRPRGDVPAAIRLEPGGQGANVAVRLARRGVRVRLVCAIGDDAAGRIVREAIEPEGVDLDDQTDGSTGIVVVLLDAAGERTMLSQRAPLGGRLSAAALTDADCLIVSGYVLAERDAGPTPFQAAEVRSRVLLGCSLDPASAVGWADAAAALRPHLTVLNDTEAATIAGAPVAAGALARRMAERLGGTVVVSHRSGASAAFGNDEVEVAAPAASQAIDTTGAGDALAAVLVAALLDADWPPDAGRMREALERAVRVAAEVTRVVGAQGRVSGEPSGTVRM